MDNRFVEKTVVCMVCSSEVERKSPGQKYCRNCSAGAYHEADRARVRMRARKKGRVPLSEMESDCYICEETYTPKNWRQKVCGRTECVKRYKHVRNQKARECRNCGEEFESYLEARRCSLTCRYAPNSLLSDGEAIESMIRLYESALETGIGIKNRTYAEASLRKWRLKSAGSENNL